MLDRRGRHRPAKSWLGPSFSRILHRLCGELLLRKFSKFDATTCEILKLKFTKSDFRRGSAPDPAGRWGAYSVPPDSLAVFKGANL